MLTGVRKSHAEPGDAKGDREWIRLRKAYGATGYEGTRRGRDKRTADQTGFART